jgi:hypothetical protein
MAMVAAAVAVAVAAADMEAVAIEAVAPKVQVSEEMVLVVPVAVVLAVVLVLQKSRGQQREMQVHQLPSPLGLPSVLGHPLPYAASPLCCLLPCCHLTSAALSLLLRSTFCCPLPCSHLTYAVLSPPPRCLLPYVALSPLLLLPASLCCTLRCQARLENRDRRVYVAYVQHYTASMLHRQSIEYTMV